MEFIKKNRLYIMLGGCALILVGLFFDFAKVSVSFLGQSVSDSKSYIDCDDGKIVLATAIISALLIWFKKEKYSLITTTITLLVVIIDMVDAKDKFADVSGYSAYGLETTVKFGMSPYIVIIGVVLAACPIVIDILEQKKIIKSK